MPIGRFQFGLTLLTGLFLLAALFAILLYVLTPETPAARGPILLASFLAILIGSLLCILFLMRWLLRPYHKLVSEAERASAQSALMKSQDEAEFVLETFQSVVGQLQEQRKELELLSAEARERANSAEKFSERIVASLPSGLIAFDANGRSMAVNTPGRLLLEVDGQALGEPCEKLFEKYSSMSDMINDCIQKGTIYRRTEVDAIDNNGRIRRLGATIAPLELPPERGRRGALCLLTDITEVTELREQVALKNNLESLGEMSAGLAHEFKNAIAALHGYVQLLQNLELNEKARSASESLLGEVRNLSDMVTSFLNFARPQPLQLEQVSLTELVSECADELQPRFRELNVRLLVEHGNESLTIGADARMLRQTLLNLMRNGAEAIEDDSTERLVKVRLSRENGSDTGNSVLIEVSDSGPGILPANLQKIFIPFFTTKAQGHGVGLALSHRVITQHGGTLTATNSNEGGAKFTVRLPYRPT